MEPVVSTQETIGLHRRPPAANRAQDVLRVLQDPVLVIETDGTIHPMNPAGKRVAEALATGDPEAGTQIRRVALHALGGMAPEPMPIGLHIAGTHHYFEATVTALNDEAVAVLRDVTAEASVREVLLESRQRYKQLVEVTADFVWECDETGAFSFVSEPGAFGYAPDQLIGRRPAGFVDAGSPAWPDRIAAPIRGRAVAVTRPDGQAAQLILDAGPILDREGARRGVRGIGRSAEPNNSGAMPRPGAAEIAEIVGTIRGEWHAEAAIRAGAAALCRRLAARGCAIHAWSQGGGWLKLAESGASSNDADVALCLDAVAGRHSTAVLNRDKACMVASAIYRDGQLAGAVVMWRAAGGAPWDEAETAVLTQVGAACGIVLRQALEMRRLVRLSRTDPLTGLLNRRAFLLELTAALARASRRRSAGAMLYIDLDNFKRLNDVCGHEAGNLALTQVGTILTHAIRPYDLAVRLGGDEFGLWLEDINTRDAGRSARRIADAIAAWSETHSPSGGTFAASIGVAMFDPNRPESPDDLIARADRAMYRAKRADDRAVVVARRRAASRHRGA